MLRRGFVLGFGGAALGAGKQSNFEAAAAILRRAAESREIRSASLFVRLDSETLARAFGEAKSPDQMFLIASITKPMTATGVMTLADKGELHLDDTVCKFIPEFSEGGRKLITIRHLLTHTSGLPDMLPENVELRRRHAPLAEFVKRTIRTPLLFKPGTRVQYQSMGILLASEVVQRITGRPFPEFLDQHVFRPLQMNRTALGLGHFNIADTALCQVDQAPKLYGGASANAASWDWNSPYWRNLAAPWGGVHSTGPDIAKFLSYFLEPDGRVLKPETARAMIVNQTAGLNEPRGIGFEVKPGSFAKGCSDRAFGHSGATGTLAWADPASGTVCVILTTLPLAVSEKKLLKPVSDAVAA